MSLRNILDENSIVGDVIKSIPDNISTVDITYANSTEVRPGMELRPTEVRYPPTSYRCSADKNSLYTLMILDPDAPSRRRPRMRNLIHQLTVNIQENDINSGDHVAPYMGAG
jgi:phosphatidylethanolamine-binding protein (PEBP) family uncharacterized protein